MLALASLRFFLACFWGNCDPANVNFLASIPECAQILISVITAAIPL